MLLIRFDRSLYWAFCFGMRTPISETHLIDCIDYMKQFPDKHFELAVVDPPYGIGAGNRTGSSKGGLFLKGYKNDTRYKKGDWDLIIPNENYWIQLFRVSKNQIVWGGNYFTHFLKASRGWIFWDKKTPIPNYSDGELAWTSFDIVLKKFEFHWMGKLRTGMEKGYKCIHPTQKPVALYKWILANYAKQGDKIIDTHLGSQSSRIAAYEMGFDFYGCELDPEYFEQGNKRFEAWLKMNGQQLFDFNDFVL